MSLPLWVLYGIQNQIFLHSVPYIKGMIHSHVNINVNFNKSVWIIVWSYKISKKNECHWNRKRGTSRCSYLILCCYLMYGIYLATWVVLRPSGLHAHDYSIIWEEFISFVCRRHNILVLFFAMFIALFCVYVMGFTLYKYIYLTQVRYKRGCRRLY